MQGFKEAVKIIQKSSFLEILFLTDNFFSAQFSLKMGSSELSLLQKKLQKNLGGNSFWVYFREAY
jgi:hypothetical protein